MGIFRDMIQEVLNNGEPHPNTDMIIQKPALYVYIKKEDLDAAKEKGIKASDEDGLFHCYFTRIPQSNPAYYDYLSSRVCVRIPLSRLKKFQDPNLVISPVNFDIGKDRMNAQDIEDYSQKNSLIYRFFKYDKDLSEIPHVTIRTTNGILPAFVLKFTLPKLSAPIKPVLSKEG